MPKYTVLGFGKNKRPDVEFCECGSRQYYVVGEGGKTRNPENLNELKFLHIGWTYYCKACGEKLWFESDPKLID